MIETKDMMSPLMGASATVTGLTLVFLGIVITARRSFEADTPRTVLLPYRIDSLLMFAAFLAGMLAVVAAGCWWVTRGEVHGVLGGFLILAGVQVVTTVCAAGRVLYRIAW